MVWHGMPWHGMVWYALVCFGMVLYGIVWYRMVSYGMYVRMYAACMHERKSPACYDGDSRNPCL